MKFIKMILIIILIINQILLASDKIILTNGLEYDCEFIRFFATQKGQYAEINVKNKLTGLPLTKIKQIVLEDSTVIFSDGEILSDSLEFSKYEPAADVIKYDGKFPLEIQQAFPQGTYITTAGSGNQVASLFTLSFDYVSNSSEKDNFFGAGFSFIFFNHQKWLAPSFIVGVKGTRRTNTFLQFSGILNDRINGIFKSFSVTGGRSISYFLNEKTLYSLKLGLGVGFGGSTPTLNLLASNDLNFRLGQSGMFLKPSIEFGFEPRNAIVSSAIGMTLILK